MTDEQGQNVWVTRLVWLVIGVGIFLRVNRYLHGFSFWGDEAWVAMDLMVRTFQNILHNTYRDVTLPNPAVGFLLLEKLMITLLGQREMVFRFFPCLFGVAGLLVFRRLLKGLVSQRAMLMALAFFVFSDMLIFYSSELKQYTSDIFFVVLILVFHRRAVKYAMDIKGTILLAVGGVIGLLFSLPIILVLCGIAFVQIDVYAYKKQRREVFRYFLIFGLWLIVFFNLWVNYYQVNYSGQDVLGYQRALYLSFPLTPADCGVWSKKLFSVFSSPVELTWSWLSALMFLAGGWSLWNRNRVGLLWLAAPIVLTVVLSTLNKYPFSGRFIIFLVPIFFILIAQGIDHLMEGRPWRRILGLVIVAVLLAQPVAQARKYVSPSGMSDIRSLMIYMRDTLKPGDGLYLSNDTQWGYFIYRTMLGVPKMKMRGILYEHPNAFDKPGQLFCYISPDRRVWGNVFSWDRVLDSKGSTIRLPGGGRTWILMSQVGGPEKEQAFIRCFDTFGKRLDEKHSNNASLYLYDLK